MIESALDLAGVSKSFGASRALSDVSLTIPPGTAHALVGGNGSGKSTLIKVLAGVHTADAGRLTVGGRTHPLSEWNAHRSHEAGLRFVHQDLGLFDDLSVAENLAFAWGFPQRLGLVRRKDLHRRVTGVLDQFDLPVRAATRARDLRPALRTMVAIARALADDDGRSVLVLDEPTASLPEDDVIWLLDALRKRVAEGHGLLYVSHRMNEIRQLCDAVTVLRDGEVSGRFGRDVHTAELVESMAGRPVERLYPARSHGALSDVVLEVDALDAGAVRDVSFSARSGEIVGVAGLQGSGKSSLARAIFGAEKVRQGRVSVSGRALEGGSVSDAIRAGVAYVPEDRYRDALLTDASVEENLVATSARSVAKGPWYSVRRARELANALIRRFRVRLRAVDDPIETLSGGNQQKVVVARWLARSPRVLVLDEPTQGVDVVARSEIYDALRGAADSGGAVVVMSSDLEELSHLCDRVLVLRAGRVVDEIAREALSAARILEASYRVDEEVRSPR